MRSVCYNMGAVYIPYFLGTCPSRHKSLAFAGLLCYNTPRDTLFSLLVETSRPCGAGRGNKNPQSTATILICDTSQVSCK